MSIVNGVATFAKSEVINKVPDRATKIALGTVVSMLEGNPHIADSIFENEIISAMLKEENGMYDINDMASALMSSMNEYGNLTVKMKGIKFISPDDKEFVFTQDDVAKLKYYIED